jgi:predicted GH43/DUF377 family glycosyl hydrolase
MELKLKRHSQPVLLPDPISAWECYNVFNPGVIFHNNLFHMFYRAQGIDWVSRIGYAVSADGLHWNRFRNPIFEPEGADESRGVEDPRITEIDGMFYMTYTAYGRLYHGEGISPYCGGGITPMIARSSNLLQWERLGPLVHGEDNKDHVLFPRKINNKYLAFHRRRPDIWIAKSTDLLIWPEREMAPVFGPRAEGYWDSNKVGANGPPIETAQGWLMIYHGTDEDNVYQMGVCLLDLDDPTKLLKRAAEPILWPEEIWEIRGDVPNVVFSNANPVVEDIVYVFYGGGDHVIGLATCTLDDLLAYVQNAP